MVTRSGGHRNALTPFLDEDPSPTPPEMNRLSQANSESKIEIVIGKRQSKFSRSLIEAEDHRTLIVRSDAYTRALEW